VRGEAILGKVQMQAHARKEGGETEKKAGGSVWEATHDALLALPVGVVGDIERRGSQGE